MMIINTTTTITTTTITTTTTTTTESAFARFFISLLPPLSQVPFPPLAAASRCGAPNFSPFIFEKKSKNAATRNTQPAYMAANVLPAASRM
jgi:hypothetical protein